MTRTILLADDSVTIQKVIELTFMDEDYQVVAVGNGDEAIEKLDEITPDFVIADVHMPGASGYEVARQSKSLRPEVPVLLLVSTFEPFDEEEAERSGCDAFLKKPFDSQELQRLVEELSAEAQGDATAEGPSPWGEPEAEEPASSPPRFGPEPAAEPGARAGFGSEADEDETEPFSIGLDEDEEPPPTQVPPPSEELQSAEGWELEPAGEAWATEASPELFELEPEAELELEEPAGEPPTEPAPPAEAVEALPAAGPLSDADVDRIARRVVELLGDKPVRDVAWEVVPDLAEVVIRARLQELESQVEPAE
ncbi:MAG TPA: response regulator [Thermoanaerobaculia bacterium]|nr:response regulator [Thermoanaerobaculia bacterium]